MRVNSRQNLKKIKQLEKELNELKTEIANKSVRLDDSQVEDFLNKLTERIEWSTNKIVDESNPTFISPVKSNLDTFSMVLKAALSFLFSGFGVLGIITLISNFSILYIGGMANIVAIGIVLMIFLCCIVIGVDIWREKDRNYLVALFSALVSLVALCVAFKIN